MQSTQHNARGFQLNNETQVTVQNLKNEIDRARFDDVLLLTLYHYHDHLVDDYSDFEGKLIQHVREDVADGREKKCRISNPTFMFASDLAEELFHNGANQKETIILAVEEYGGDLATLYDGDDAHARQDADNVRESWANWRRHRKLKRDAPPAFELIDDEVIANEPDYRDVDLSVEVNDD